MSDSSPKRALTEPHLANLMAYVPGKPIEETEREYGITNISKLASNENCLGPSKLAIAAVTKALPQAHLYPDAGGFYLKERLLKKYATQKVKAEQLVLGNGTNEILTLIVRAFVGEGEATLIGWPSFVVYRLSAKGTNRKEVAVPLKADFTYDLDAMADALEEHKDIKVVFLANPNNPTGTYFTDAAFDAFMKRVPDDVVVVIDEAYAEYVDKSDYPDGLSWVQKRPRTIMTRTFSKIYGLAAMRIGYAVCDAELAAVLNRLREPFNANALAQVAAKAALDDDAHVEAAKAHNLKELPRLHEGLVAMGLEVTPSVANFVLAHTHHDVKSLVEALMKRGVIVRPLAVYGLKKSMRITVGTESENNRLLSAMKDALETLASAS